MSDTYDDDAVTADELLLEDALAGDPDALATVTADDELLGRFEALVSLRDAVRAPAPAVPDAVSEAHLAAAPGAFSTWPMLSWTLLVIDPPVRMSDCSLASPAMPARTFS